ncbi:MAG: hydroxymethylpyrimidine/phosphomethylpyrimidine kinase, partial [Muribaculaceae bacterium]|nr:hydroxymethylpyrimidine/phosphomethylpyrimidine kinase [Muribaculaceae bacterium]
NLPEAKALTGRAVFTPTEILEAAQELRALGARGVLIKGGHGGAEELIDYYVDRDQQERHFHRRIATPNTHGTGCTLSSAIASFMARGEETAVAVAHGIEWLQGALRAGADLELGHGHGPVNHLYHAN